MDITETEPCKEVESVRECTVNGQMHAIWIKNQQWKENVVRWCFEPSQQHRVISGLALKQDTATHSLILKRKKRKKKRVLNHTNNTNYLPHTLLSLKHFFFFNGRLEQTLNPSDVWKCFRCVNPFIASLAADGLAKSSPQGLKICKRIWPPQVRHPNCSLLLLPDVKQRCTLYYRAVAYRVKQLKTLKQKFKT